MPRSNPPAQFRGLDVTYDREIRFSRALSAAGLVVLEFDPREGSLAFFEDPSCLLGFDRVPTRTELLERLQISEFQRLKGLYFRATKAPSDNRETDFRYLHPDGTTRWLNARYSAVPSGVRRHPMVRAIISDITARKTKEVALQQRDLIKSAILETALDAIITVDAAGLVVSWNAAAEHLFGHSRDVAIGRDLAELIYPPDQTSSRQVGMRRMLAANGSVLGRKMELEMVHADGSKFDGELSFRQLDIDGEKQFTAFMRASQKSKDGNNQVDEKHLRTAIDLNSSIAWLASADGCVTYLNVAWQEFTGRTSADSLPIDWMSSIHPHDVASFLLLWDECTKNGVSNVMDTRFLSKAGTYHWCEVTCRPQLSDGGEVTGWISTAVDVTERRALEDALREQRDKLWNMSRDLIGVYRPDGTMVAFNPAWTSLLGISEQEMQQSEFSSWLRLDGVRRSSIGPSLHSEGDRIFMFDAKIDARDGSQKLVSWTIAPHDGLYYAVGRDMTAERESTDALELSQAALLQSQKMEAIGQLTGGIAHDLNNALQGIVGGLSLTEGAIARNDKDRVRDSISIAMRASKRATSFIDRLLTFARRKSLDLAPTNVNELVMSMQSLITATIDSRSQIEFDLDPAAFEAIADTNQLESALINLAINARDAMQSGGTLRISTENVVNATAGGFGPSDWLIVRVSDTGTGMRPEEVEKAFEPFFTTKPVGQGSGLGLSIVYGFIKQIGGHVEIESGLGAGTTVSMWLPRAIPAQPTQTIPAAVDPTGLRVMVVEPEPSTRTDLTVIFGGMGCAVQTASSAEEAIPLLQVSPADLVVTADVLPGMNGRQLSDIARQHQPGLKAIFLTGYMNSPVLAAGPIPEGMLALMRPTDHSDLLEAIRSLFGMGDSIRTAAA